MIRPVFWYPDAHRSTAHAIRWVVVVAIVAVIALGYGWAQ